MVEHGIADPMFAGSIPVTPFFFFFFFIFYLFIYFLIIIYIYNNKMHLLGFEPTPPERTELESVALDHSAIDAYNILDIILFIFTLFL